MANVAVICAFIRMFLIVILVPPVLYGSMFASRAARQFDARIDRTMFVGGLSTCLSTLVFSIPFYVSDVLSGKDSLSRTQILFLAILLGVLIGVFWGIVHLFTTHSKSNFRSDDNDADSIEY